MAGHNRKVSSVTDLSKVHISEVKFRKEVNLVYAISLMSGCIIGSGIFVSPASMAYNCGSVGLTLVIWVVSGLLTLPVVLCYAELGAMFPTAGGEYNFYKQVLGELPAFLAMWILNVVVLPAFYAILTLTTSNYLLYPFYNGCPLPDTAVKLLSTWLMVTTVVLNSVYVRYVARVQTFFTAVKVLALVIIVITGFVQLAKGKTENLSTGFENTSTDPGAIAVAIYSGIFSYGGWQYLFVMLEEVKRPEKIVPTATIISMLSVIILYLFTNIAYFTVMSPNEMMASPVVAVTFAENTLGSFSLIVPLLVACSTIGALNGALLGGSRMSFAAARDGLFPEIFGTIQTKYLTPWVSLWALCVLSVIFIVTGEAVNLIEYLGFIAGLIFITSLWCVIYLRWKKPDIPRPIKVPLPVTIFLFIIMILLALLGLYKRPKDNGIGVLLLISGIPVYLLGVTLKKKPEFISKFMYSMTTTVQKVLLVTEQDKAD